MQYLARLLAFVSVLIVGCTDPVPSPTAPAATVSPHLTITDARGGGMPGFYFLPPLVRDSGPFSGTFDGTSSPSVRICELTLTAPVACRADIADVATFTTEGKGASKVTADFTDEAFHVLWKTPSNLLVGKDRYRLEVSVAKVRIGYADLWVVSKERDTQSVTSGYVAAVAGSPLKLKFRIETALPVQVKAIGPDGGTVSSRDGKLTITIPPGALSSSLPISIAEGTSSARPGILSGTALYPSWSLGPSGTKFSLPVTVTLSYADIPAAVAAVDRLGITHWTDSRSVAEVVTAAQNAQRSVLIFSLRQFSNADLVRRDSPSGWATSQVRWTVPEVRYYVEPNLNSYLTRDANLLVFEAAQEWQSASGIRFAETTDPSRAHIVLRENALLFCPGLDPASADAVGRACFGEEVGRSRTELADGDVATIQIDSRAIEASSDAEDLAYTVIRHELGHAVGLMHPWVSPRDCALSAQDCPVMSEFVKPRGRGLNVLDIEAIQSIYGPRLCTGASCPAPPSTPAPTPVPPPDSTTGNPATSWGDPHLITPDGLRYDFQAKGDFVFAQSTDAADDFEVHIRFVPGGAGGVTATGAVAARVVGDVVALYPNGSSFDVVINGQATDGTNALNQRLQGGGTVQVTPNAATISWPDRTVLSINQGTGYYRGATLLLSPSRLGKVRGLVGNYDGNANNDLRLPNGTAPQGLYEDYRTEWRVPLGSVAALFQRGPDPWDFTPPTPPDLGSFSAAALAAARQTCIAAGVTSPAIIETCALDVLVTGDNGLAVASAKADPATVSVLVSPALSYLTPGASRNFTAAVTGLSSGSVSWTTTGGSIAVTGSNSMTFTAPSAPGTYAITARSVQNSSIIATATVVVSLVCTNPQPGLVSWWPGDGNASDIVSGNHGVPQNGTTFVSGKVGQAFSFDGLKDYVSIPDSPTLTPPSNSVTLDAWIKPDIVSGPHAIVTKYSPALDISWILMVLDGRVRFAVFQSGAADIGRMFDTVNPVINTGVWQHIAGTFDVATQTVRIYVNGVEVPANISPATPLGPVTSIRDSNSPVRIGALQAGGGDITYFWDGLIDEVDLFNRALTSTQIQAIFSGSAVKCGGAFNQSPGRRSR